MKRLLLILFLVGLTIIPVSAEEIPVPTVPESAETYMPEDTESFSEGLWYIITAGLGMIMPELRDALSICIKLVAIVILMGMVSDISATGKKVVALAGALAVSLVLLGSSGSLVSLGTQTVNELSDYGKLILPTLTAALAAQGGITQSTAIYTGTALFSAVLSTCITKILIPLIWIYICLGIAQGFLENESIGSLKQFSKWLITWSLKIILYIFTGYMTVTGVVSGSADAMAIKATKIGISGFVPVVGGIISDASEAILISAGAVKHSVGIYGMLASGAIIIGPFITIGLQYILLKITCALCKVMGNKQTVSIIGDFSKVMGMILAMIGAQGLMLIVSVFCFMRGIQ